ncbi:MAG: L-threonylcarbamoyladenylate synthase [Oligoflexia bacterium]|jgi:L-threonylcarbamoyladenylate synthase
MADSEHLKSFSSVRVLSGGLQGISRCMAHLRAGKILAIPTETVYGLAAIATRADAVAQIFAAKQRPSFDPLIVHIPPGWGFLKKLDEKKITESSLLSPEARTIAETLMKRFWPGPLTLILPRGAAIPDLVTSGLSTVGIRMPRHTLAQDLLKHLQEPLAAPSANRFGSISPTSSQAVIRELEGRIEYVLEGGPCEVGLESTIVHIAPDATCRLLRPGGLPKETIESIIRPLGRSLLPPDPSVRSSAEIAPGMLASHYAPRKKLTLFFRSELKLHETSSPETAILWLTPPPREFGLQASSITKSPRDRVLSESGSEAETARNLFAMLRALDENPEFTQILAERPEGPQSAQGLGAAILDRLLRASAPKSIEPVQG